MKRYFKFILLALIAIVFIGTFVFLYIKSQPQPVVYDEFTPKLWISARPLSLLVR